MLLRTSVTEWVGHVFLALHGQDNPSEEEWQEGLLRIRQGMQPNPCILVWSLGGGPGPKQRAELNKAFAMAKPRTAVMTNSAVVRAIGVAVRWVQPQVRIFNLQAYEEARAFLGLDDVASAQVQRRLRELQRFVTTDSPTTSALPDR